MKYLRFLHMLLLCLLLAGCAEDKDSLSDLYTGQRENVTCIDLFSDQGHCCLGAPDFLSAAWALLDQMEYDSTQMLTDTLDEDERVHMLIFYADREGYRLGFSQDFSRVIPDYDAGLGPEYSYYPVQSPDVLRGFYEKHIAIIYNREVTAPAFAMLGQPHAWIQGVTADALYQVRLGYAHSSSSGGSTAMSAVAFEELLTLLKDLPESAFSQPEVIGESGQDHITCYYTSRPNLAVNFQDGANDLGVIIRYYEEADALAHLEFLMVDKADYLSPENSKYIRPVTKWDLNAPAVLQWFRSNAQFPPYASLRFGHWMTYDQNRDYVRISHKETAIKVRCFDGWTYEVEEYKPDCDSFGVRFRHPKQTDGWIYISFWPDGYENTERNRYLSTNSSGYTSYPLTVLYPNGMDPEGHAWSVQVTHYEHGDYVILNEGADHWFADYSKEIDVQLGYSWVDAGERIQMDPPEMVIDIDYTQSDDYKEGFKQFHFKTPDPIMLSLKGWDECSWVHDDTPEEDVLLTYWPQYETEGKVCVEYHEGFFQPPEGMIVEEDELHIQSYGGAHPAKRGTLPGDNHWSYFWIDRKHGSYVFRFENTEHWGQRKIEECLWTLHTILFQS